ncbi:unnamed protein product [Protopolystoma xenopodis]|uniref:Calpain catalytic domain-containing protein n=1 Tax=Protopolystoma xenopodis TaxID=117903 RepID=A0A3S5ALN0_9PLAT|nr:unnamed protein product [Protopolystoma xenopodis]
MARKERSWYFEFESSFFVKYLHYIKIFLSIQGINAPIIGNVGITISSDTGVQFGRFRDPRERLRNRDQNKVVVPSDFGRSADKPVPATRGGDIANLSLSFEHLRATLLSENKLFEDPEFPAADSSLFFSQLPPRKIEWMRPGDIVDDPMFFSEGVSRFDVRQGELGDCWLLAAIACLCMHKELFDQVVPEQTFSKQYCGLFRFNFWYFGEWKEIVVDDRLPCYRGKLLYMHSTEKKEFWSALMEKAYAKLCGSYEALKGGTTSEALEDFTGGIAENFELRDKSPPNLMDIMLKSQEHSSLMGCSIQADPNVFEARLPNGLIMGHAYSVTSVKLVGYLFYRTRHIDIALPGKTGKIPLVRIRNPWGNEAEWKGAWSDKSNEWSLISDVQRQELGLVFEDDGEFW